MDDGAKKTGSVFGSVPIEVTISVGKARPMIKDLLAMQPNSVMSLDRRVDDPVELYVGDRLIARGELQEIDSPSGKQLAVRITDVTEQAAQF